MAKYYLDSDISLSIIEGKTLAVIGYGNQGRSQALNLRDSGYKVVIGNRDDEYADLARQDGFAVVDISTSVQSADVVFLIIPDEAQPEVYNQEIEPSLHPGAAICFSHGYNIFFGNITPRNDLDVILVAPKMLGEFVRSHYLEGDGFPTLVATSQDASGHAMDTALALAKAMGGARRGAWVTTFEEETVTDLFGEQAGGASALKSTIYAFETLTEAGYDPDVVTLELYASGELGDVLSAVARVGMLNGLRLHSSASRYGQLSRADRMVPEEAKETLRALLSDIQSGAFAKELSAVAADNYQPVEMLLERYNKHPLFAAEARVRIANKGERAAQ